MKTAFFTLLLFVAIILAFVCGYLFHSRSDSLVMAEVESRTASALARTSERDQLEWDLRIVSALDQGKTKEVLSWSNVRIDGWLINRAADSRLHPFPHASDEPWDLNFVTAVARQRAQNQISNDDPIVEETIAGILKRAVELSKKTEQSGGEVRR